MPNVSAKEELEQLQLEEARAAALERKQKREQERARQMAIVAALKKDAAMQARIQASCAHKKGGKGVSAIYSGNDANYAVVVHTLSHGVTIVVCQRCGKIWAPPEPLPRGAAKEQRETYREALNTYRWARNLPTDNEPSGTTLFAFEREEETAA